MTHPARARMDRYRCPETFLNLTLQDVAPSDPVFFRFRSNAICYGRSAAGRLRPRVDASLYDVSGDVRIDQSEVSLPFNPTEVIDNFRFERYGAPQSWIRKVAKSAYYRWAVNIATLDSRRGTKISSQRMARFVFSAWPVRFSPSKIYVKIFCYWRWNQRGRSDPFYRVLARGLRRRRDDDAR